MYLCITCTDLELGDKRVRKNCICSKCTIKIHMKKGHRTADFFPYLSVNQFLANLKHIDSKCEKYKTSDDKLKESITNFNVLSQRVTENIDVLKDMARRSKSSKYQAEAMEKMEKFIDESKDLNLKMHSELKESTKKVQKNLKKLEDWYATRTDSCVDDSQTIPLPCSIL